MPEKLLLSFIVPVYNVEKYLNECLDSIFDPSVNEDEYEVIVIDDGSTDSSLEILKTYLHHRNFRLITQKNSGQGPARNTGIKIAKGRYIHFIDSDDYLLPGAVPTLLDLARESDCDIVEFEFHLSHDLRSPVWQYEPQTERTPTTGTGKVLFAEWMKQHAFLNAPWMRIYKSSFLIDNALYFSDLKISGNDAEWQYRCFFYAEKVNYLPIILYNYRMRDDSITLLSKGSKKSYDRFQLIKALHSFMKEIEPNEENSDFIRALGAMLAVWLEECVNNAYKTVPKHERDEMFRQIKGLKEVMRYANNEKAKRIYKIARWLPAGLAIRMYKFF